MENLHLRILEGEYAVWKLPPDADFPSCLESEFLAITRTPAELSGVSQAGLAPHGAEIQTGWRCIAVKGPLPFELTGILASIASPLARAGISIFAVSTFDTDYLLIPAAGLNDAIRVLSQAGHIVETSRKK